LIDSKLKFPFLGTLTSNIPVSDRRPGMGSTPRKSEKSTGSRLEVKGTKHQLVGPNRKSGTCSPRNRRESSNLSFKSGLVLS